MRRKRRKEKRRRKKRWEEEERELPLRAHWRWSSFFGTAFNNQGVSLDWVELGGLHKENNCHVKRLYSQSCKETNSGGGIAHVWCQYCCHFVSQYCNRTNDLNHACRSASLEILICNKTLIRIINHVWILYGRKFWWWEGSRERRVIGEKMKFCKSA